MAILGGLNIHRGQVTFDYIDTSTGEVTTGKIRDPHRVRFRAWLDELGGVAAAVAADMDVIG